MALLEYAVLLLHSRTRNGHSSGDDGTGKEEREKAANQERIFILRKDAREKNGTSTDVGKGTMLDRLIGKLGYKTVDSIALLVFAAAFFLFNVFYWSFYL